MTSPNFHDIEQLSSLLDGRLPEAEARRLRARLAEQAALRAAYEQLRQARFLLHQLPARRVPRNFTLLRQMAGLRAPTPRFFPFFQWASALTAIFFLLSLGLNWQSAGAPAADAPMLAAAPAAAESIPAATEMPPLAAMAPAATSDPGAELRSLAPEATSVKMAPPADTQNGLPAASPAPASSWPKSSGALAGLALLLALTGWGIRWRAEQKFRRGA